MFSPTTKSGPSVTASTEYEAMNETKSIVAKRCSVSARIPLKWSEKSNVLLREKSNGEDAIDAEAKSLLYYNDPPGEIPRPPFRVFAILAELAVACAGCVDQQTNPGLV